MTFSPEIEQRNKKENQKRKCKEKKKRIFFLIFFWVDLTRQNEQKCGKKMKKGST